MKFFLPLNLSIALLCTTSLSAIAGGGSGWRKEEYRTPLASCSTPQSRAEFSEVYYDWDDGSDQMALEARIITSQNEVFTFTVEYIRQNKKVMRSPLLIEGAKLHGHFGTERETRNNDEVYTDLVLPLNGHSGSLEIFRFAGQSKVNGQWVSDYKFLRKIELGYCFAR